MAIRYQTIDGKKQLMRVRFSAAHNHTISEKFKDVAGKIYARMVDGSVRRFDPLKPWHGKSERRAVLKQRREDREYNQPVPTAVLVS